MLVEPTDYLSREQLDRLRRIQPLRSLGAVAWTWGWIVGCFALYAVHPSVVSVAVAWVVMSGRHLALAILMHEAAHGLLLRNKPWNDRIGQWLTAYPTMADTLLYRRAHFQHHKHTWTEQDPDLGLATALPVSRASFRRKMIRDLTGQTAYARHRIIARYAAGLHPRGQGREGKSWLQLVRAFASNQRGFLWTNAVLLGGLTLAGIPEAYLLIWWLPAWTGYSVVLRLRSIAEHACVADPTDPLRQTRTTLAPGWLRFLLAPHHVNYHLEHHLFITVPHYNLPAAHRMLADAGVLARAEVAPNYLQVLLRATSVVGALCVALACSSPPVDQALEPVSDRGGAAGSSPDASASDPTASVSRCDLDSGYPGDELCIEPPPPDQGFQLHIGPSDYANPEPEYLLLPGQEVTTDFPAVSGNTEPVYFYHRQYRMRPGTHHNIVGTADLEIPDLGRRLAITNHLVEDNPKGGELAPENAGVGIALAPATALVVNVHSINVTDEPVVRELWVNFWYRDPADVTEPVVELAAAGDTEFAIEPRADTMLGPYRCEVSGDGRILWMYGHRHANNERFSAWRIRGAERTLLYEAFRWDDPLLLEFSSTVQNPLPDRARRIDGGYSGVLDLRAGDFLEWECHVINKTDGYLRFTNENFTGEMCILDAELVGVECL